MTEKSGLCLSGGGVKGFAHIGVLKALEENNITFDAVSGNSAGSLVGAAYALGYSSDEILEFCKNQKLTDILGYSSISKKYADVKQGENAVNMIKNFNPAINSEIIENFLLALIGDKGFDDMKIPFYCVAVNLKDGREIVFEDGELGKCCRASCSIPGVFTPVEYNDMILVDGMVSNNMPADVLKNRGIDKVLSVNLKKYSTVGKNSTKYLDILTTTIDIMAKRSFEQGLANSNLVISPMLDIKSSFNITNDMVDNLYNIGYNEAVKNMDKITALFSKN